MEQQKNRIKKEIWRDNETNRKEDIDCNCKKEQETVLNKQRRNDENKQGKIKRRKNR